MPRNGCRAATHSWPSSGTPCRGWRGGAPCTTKWLPFRGCLHSLTLPTKPCRRSWSTAPANSNNPTAPCSTASAPTYTARAGTRWPGTATVSVGTCEIPWLRCCRSAAPDLSFCAPGAAGHRCGFCCTPATCSLWVAHANTDGNTLFQRLATQTLASASLFDTTEPSQATDLVPTTPR